MTHPLHQRSKAEITRLDDLFKADDSPLPRALPARQDREWLVGAGLQTFLASAVVYTLLHLVDRRLPYPLILAVCLGAVLIRRAVRLAREPLWPRAGDLVRPVEVRRRREPGAWYEGGDGMASAIRRWDRQFTWGLASGPRFANTAGPRLGELVDERLRQRHGITRAADPARARELVGEKVWALLGPLERAPTHRQIMAALADLDRL